VPAISPRTTWLQARFQLGGNGFSLENINLLNQLYHKHVPSTTMKGIANKS